MWPRCKGLFACLATLGAVLVVNAALAAPSSAAPSCAEGPQIVGDTILGTPCGDTIRAPRGVPTVNGEGGDDVISGQRGNDQINGGEGNDRLYGGIGDDRPRGGAGDDFLSGGFGADSLDGEGGNDFVRGDATIDAIADTGGGTDTLSFATGVTPGFPNEGPFFDYAGFPSAASGRGAYVDLAQGFANNGLARSGGGVDLELDGTSFERVIGTPFPDFLVGSSNAETIYGGGGADVILGEGGAHQLHGGAEGDSCSGSGAVTDCETSAKQVQPRDAGAIAVGAMTPAGVGPPALYLTGSDEEDVVTATYAAGAVSFTLGAGSEGDFDPSAAGGCNPPAAGEVICPLAESPDTVLLAGLGQDDTIVATGFPETVSVVLLGGEGDDLLTGGGTEDALIDGAGADTVDAGARGDGGARKGGGETTSAAGARGC